MEAIRFQELLKQYVGGFGKYQGRIISILLLDKMFIAFSIMSVVFIAAVPPHRCKIPAMEEYRIHQNKNEASGEGLRALDFYTKATEPCQEWEYDFRGHGITLISQYDAVCSYKWKKAVINSSLLIGMIGGVVLAYLNDRYGRRKTIIFAGVTNVFVGIIGIYSYNFYVYIITRMLQGASLITTYYGNLFIAVECVSNDWRGRVCNLLFVTWAVGYMGLAGIAYLLRHHDWKVLATALSLPQLIYYLLVFIFVPESPQWLYLKRRNDEAYKIVSIMAKINGGTFPKSVRVEEETDPKSRTFLELFRYPKLRFVTILMIYNYSVNGFVYYGLSLNTSDLAGNPYINFLISGAVEIPAYCYCLWSADKFGRIKSYTLTMLAAGISLIISSVVPVGWWSTGFALLGKFFISATFGIIIMYSPEVFPTCVRSQGTAIAATALAISGGLLFLLLPETKGCAFTQTLEEAERAFAQRRKLLRFGRKTVAVLEEKDDPSLHPLS